MSAVPQCFDNWQEGFLQVLPTVRSHARIQFRSLPGYKKEEAVQEAIASACVSYQLLAARGKLHVARPCMLAKFAVQAVRSGRHVGGSQDTVSDVLSPVAQTRHRFRTEDVASLEADSPGWKQVAIADRKASVPDVAAFRVDFAEWLKTLSERDRRIISVLATGEGSGRVAQRFGISVGRVSQLRHVYEQGWRSYQGELAA